jgi:hypothetical protein
VNAIPVTFAIDADGVLQDQQTNTRFEVFLFRKLTCNPDTIGLFAHLCPSPTSLEEKS